MKKKKKNKKKKKKKKKIKKKKKKKKKIKIKIKILFQSNLSNNLQKHSIIINIIIIKNNRFLNPHLIQFQT